MPIDLTKLQQWTEQTEEDDALLAQGTISELQYDIRMMRRLAMFPEDLLVDGFSPPTQRQRFKINWSKFGF